MAKTKKQPALAATSLRNLEIVHSSFTDQKDIEAKTEDFTFAVNVENKIDSSQNLIVSTVSIEIGNDNASEIFATIIFRAFFLIENLKEFLTLKDGKYEISQELLEKLNIITISTTRGVIFMMLKGTSLHNAFLPLVEATKLHMVQKS